MMKLCRAFRHPLFPILPSHRVLLTHQQPENWAISALKNNAKIKGKTRLSKGESTAVQGILEGNLFLTWGKKKQKDVLLCSQSIDAPNDVNLAQACPAGQLLGMKGTAPQTEDKSTPPASQSGKVNLALVTSTQPRSQTQALRVPRQGQCPRAPWKDQGLLHFGRPPTLHSHLGCHWGCNRSARHMGGVQG